MAGRQHKHKAAPAGQSNRELVYVGDVREAPVEVQGPDSAVRPVVAVWVRASDGYVVGTLIDQPGHPAQTLVDALRSPVAVPGELRTPIRPARVVLFDEELAKQVRALLAPQRIEVVVSPPLEPFDDMFADLFDHLKRAGQAWPAPDVPEQVLKPLLSAAERLWRAKPWEYAFDYPPFAIVPAQAGARPLYASILGANEEVYGVALYTSVEDLEATLTLGESTIEQSPDSMTPEEMEAAATEVLAAMRHASFLLSLEPRGEMPAAYREQVIQAGWSRRLSVVPTFARMGGGAEPESLTAEEAAEVTLAVDALVAFCQRHRARIGGDDFPIRDTVEVGLAGKAVRVYVSVPG